MEIRKLRQDLMIVTNTINLLQDNYAIEYGKGSRELSLSKTSSQLAMMWTGNFLKFSKLGDNPYAKNDGSRKTVDDIQPLFDETDRTLDLIDGTNSLISLIDELREYLDRLLSEFQEYWIMIDIDFEDQHQEFSTMNSGMNIINYISETKLWLGMTLGTIRDMGK